MNVGAETGKEQKLLHTFVKQTNKSMQQRGKGRVEDNTRMGGGRGKDAVSKKMGDLQHSTAEPSKGRTKWLFTAPFIGLFEGGKYIDHAHRRCQHRIPPRRCCHGEDDATTWRQRNLIARVKQVLRDTQFLPHHNLAMRGGAVFEFRMRQCLLDEPGGVRGEMDDGSGGTRGGGAKGRDEESIIFLRNESDNFSPDKIICFHPNPITTGYLSFFQTPFLPTIC